MATFTLELGDEPIELKNCPFCGSDKIDIFRIPNSSYRTVECKSCRTKGPVSVNIEFAIAWWNIRK